MRRTSAKGTGIRGRGSWSLPAGNTWSGAGGTSRIIADIENIVVGADERGTPILVKNIGKVVLGPDIRRGSAELDGTGEVVGGIVVVRFGVNSYDVIQRVKEKIKEITPSLPEG